MFDMLMYCIKYHNSRATNFDKVKNAETRTDKTSLSTPTFLTAECRSILFQS